MFFGWQDKKYVLLVQNERDGTLIARISMKSEEAEIVAESIMIDSIDSNKCHQYKEHEQIV